jgi:methylmalonyl-CoA/ethylmalonyl-CoA epimerase
MDLVQVAQRAQDLPRAAAFYERLLGEPPVATFDPPGLVFFALGSTRLLLGRDAPSGLLYLQVDDVRDQEARLKAAGIDIVSEPHVIFTHDDDALGPAGTREWQMFVRDSEDNLVSLVSFEHVPHP